LIKSVAKEDIELVMVACRLAPSACKKFGSCFQGKVKTVDNYINYFFSLGLFFRSLPILMSFVCLLTGI